MVESFPEDIVTTVADVKGVEPTELDYALQEHIDTDALQQLASDRDASWMLSFELPDHEITVTNDGLILVDGDLEDTWS